MGAFYDLTCDDEPAVPQPVAPVQTAAGVRKATFVSTLKSLLITAHLREMQALQEGHERIITVCQKEVDAIETDILNFTNMPEEFYGNPDDLPAAYKLLSTCLDPVCFVREGRENVPKELFLPLELWVQKVFDENDAYLEMMEGSGTTEAFVEAA